jgi:phosphotransacetylase
MREVTAGTTGLRTARRISHVFIMDVPTHSETLFITDAAINIFPDLEAKRDIVQNAIDLFTHGGLGTPRVAILSPVETVTPKTASIRDFNMIVAPLVWAGSSARLAQHRRRCQPGDWQRFAFAQAAGSKRR